jgi:CheY-like chemotaxis protein
MVEEKSKILIVDDDELTCKLMSRILDIYGYTTIAVNSGKEALEFVQNKPVDIMLVDFMMPEMGGIELCQRLKNNPMTSSIIVILLTASTDSYLDDMTVGAGADGFIRKLFDVENFVGYIEEVERGRGLIE